MTVFTYDFISLEIEPDTFTVIAQELGNSIKTEFAKLENIYHKPAMKWTGNDPVGSQGGKTGLNIQMLNGWTIRWPAQISPTFAEIVGGTIGNEIGDPPFSNVPADNIIMTRSIDRTPAQSEAIAGGTGGDRTLDK